MWGVDDLFVVSPNKIVEQIVELVVIWDTMTVMWRHTAACVW